MSNGIYVRVKYRDEVCFEQKFRAISGDTIVLTVDDLVDEKVKAEREKVAKWMMQRSYATGHGETMEDLLAELDWQIAENWNRAMINGIETEREACAKVAEAIEKDRFDAVGDPRIREFNSQIALAIKERGAP